MLTKKIRLVAHSDARFEAFDCDWNLFATFCRQIAFVNR